MCGAARLDDRIEALRRVQRLFLRHSGGDGGAPEVAGSESAKPSSKASSGLFQKIRGSSARAIAHMSQSSRGRFDFELKQLRGQIELLQAQVPLQKQRVCYNASIAKKPDAKVRTTCRVNMPTKTHTYPCWQPRANLLGQPLCNSMYVQGVYCVSHRRFVRSLVSLIFDGLTSAAFKPTCTSPGNKAHLSPTKLP